jgi:hypothetical protein
LDIAISESVVRYCPEVLTPRSCQAESNSCHSTSTPCAADATTYAHLGSGKSSILQMLEMKITASDPATKVWLFDCEQN